MLSPGHDSHFMEAVDQQDMFRSSGIREFRTKTSVYRQVRKLSRRKQDVKVRKGGDHEFHGQQREFSGCVPARRV